MKRKTRINFTPGVHGSNYAYLQATAAPLHLESGVRPGLLGAKVRSDEIRRHLLTPAVKPLRQGAF